MPLACRSEKQRWSWKSRKLRQLSNCKRSFLSASNWNDLETVLPTITRFSVFWKQYYTKISPPPNNDQWWGISRLRQQSGLWSRPWWPSRARWRPVRWSWSWSWSFIIMITMVNIMMILPFMVRIIIWSSSSSSQSQIIISLSQTRIQQRRLRPGAEFCHDEVHCHWHHCHYNHRNLQPIIILAKNCQSHPNHLHPHRTGGWHLAHWAAQPLGPHQQAGGGAWSGEEGKLAQKVFLFWFLAELSFCRSHLSRIIFPVRPFCKWSPLSSLILNLYKTLSPTGRVCSLAPVGNTFLFFSQPATSLLEE